MMFTGQQQSSRRHTCYTHAVPQCAVAHQQSSRRNTFDPLAVHQCSVAQESILSWTHLRTSRGTRVCGDAPKMFSATHLRCSRGTPVCGDTWINPLGNTPSILSQNTSVRWHTNQSSGLHTFDPLAVHQCAVAQQQSSRRHTFDPLAVNQFAVARQQSPGRHTFDPLAVH